ncbi:MAG: CRISPR-associated helicase Cas3' [Candidatus Aenigmatarchaeota archaeon]|nr:CRISPR-associated helicase Cas3' [Methanothermobacter sp.]
MELIETLRAKSSDQENYLLKDHLKETVNRIVAIYNFFEENRGNFTYDLDRVLFEKLVVAAIIHDLGKIDYNFQRKVLKSEEIKEKNWIELKEFFKPLMDLQSPLSLRHEILSSIWSTFLIGNDKLDKKIRTAILLHHYNEYFATERDLMEIIYTYEDQIKSYLEFIMERRELLEDFLAELLGYIKGSLEDSIVSSAIDYLKEQADFKKAKVLLAKIKGHDDDISDFARFYNPRLEDHDFLVLLGLLRRSDYSASANVPIESYTPRIFLDIEDNLEKRIPREKLWQEVLLDKIDPGDSLVLVAPTGSGKTEFAILWAAKNNRKLIYTLPLRVALNDLFIRFRNRENGYFNASNVDILHSTAFIEYMDEEKRGKSIDLDKMLTSARLLASPVLLTTPDQVFLTSLNYYGSDKIISIYPFSSFIIDEVQTYNEEMAAIIIKTVNIIRELGGKVMIMTATFPPYFEKFFKDFNFVDVKDHGLHVKNLDLKRHKIRVIDKPLFVEGDNGLEIYEESEDEIKKILKANDKNFFIVVNNVGKAIRLYEILNEDYPNVYLLHSRILEVEKDRRLKEIKRKVESEEKVIVVSTQIIEASVDLDFDMMITEISTIDSQIQRWGRIHRNRNTDYQEDEPNIVIFTGKVENGDLKIDNGTMRIYDKKVVEKTREVLKEHEGETFDYTFERNLISEVFKRKIEGLTLKKHYENKIENILRDLEYFTVEKKSQAQLLFRKIAGIKIIIPDIVIQDSNNKIQEIFGECIKEGVKTWKKIIEKIEEKTGKKVDIWSLKKLLYEYSINMPVYYEEKSDFWSKTTGEFKGFYIWGNINKNELDQIKELGLDSIFKDTNSTNIL